MHFVWSKKYSLIVTILVILLSVFIGTFRTYLVMGASDAPTLFSGDKVIINRSAFDITFPFSSIKLFQWTNPQRGDMILCCLPKNGNEDYWLKRVVGIPGDTIKIIKNRLFINNKPLKYEILKRESFEISENIITGDLFAVESGFGLEHTIAYSDQEGLLSDYGPVIVKSNHYFVLGDNRDNSMDSRIFGLVSRENVFGKYIFRLSQVNRS